MSGRVPPRKRRKTLKTSVGDAPRAASRSIRKPSPSTVGVSPGSVPVSEPSLTDLVAQLLPAVTQGVLKALADSGLLSPTIAPTPASTGLASSAVTVAEPVVAASASGSYRDPGFIPSVSDPEILDGPVDTPRSAVLPSAGCSAWEPHTSSGPGLTDRILVARPLSLGVDSKLKGLIWSDSYVDFALLLGKSDSGGMEVVPDSSGVLICRQQPSFKVRTLDLWLRAFHVFVAVYCSRHPGQAANLMKYASTIQKLAQQAGVGAALSYDKSFRQWKEDDPSQLPWEQLNVELFNQALAMGLTQKA